MKRVSSTFNLSFFRMFFSLLTSNAAIFILYIQKRIRERESLLTEQFPELLNLSFTAAGGTLTKIASKGI